MFTGIVEALGVVILKEEEGTNVNLCIESSISNELKVDQSVAHNGVCLTVTKVEEGRHYVTAIDETIKKTNFSELEVGTRLNLERCMKSDGRFDGHMVYGHVDGVGTCIGRKDDNGSTVFTIQFAREYRSLIVEKGSVTLNGTSLTVFDITDTSFKVAIIPYTMEHTTIQFVQEGYTVNLEFDILGKYVQRLMNK